MQTRILVYVFRGEGHGWCAAWCTVWSKVKDKSECFLNEFVRANTHTHSMCDSLTGLRIQLRNKHSQILIYRIRVTARAINWYCGSAVVQPLTKIRPQSSTPLTKIVIHSVSNGRNYIENRVFHLLGTPWFPHKDPPGGSLALTLKLWL